MVTSSWTYPETVVVGQFRLKKSGEMVPVGSPEQLADLTKARIPHEEIYLDLARVDLDDPIAILGFVNKYGILGVRAPSPRCPLSDAASGGHSVDAPDSAYARATAM